MRELIEQILPIFRCLVFVSVFFLNLFGPAPWHVELPGQGSDPSCSFAYRQHRILNPLSQAGDGTCVPVQQRRQQSHCATAETPIFSF